MKQSSMHRRVRPLALFVAVLASLLPFETTNAQAAYHVSVPVSSAVTQRGAPTPIAQGYCADSSVADQILNERDSHLAASADDSIEAEILAPGSGMVAVDSHGRLITAGDSAPSEVAPPRVGCCAPVVGSTSESRLVPAPSVTYTASSGSDLARCADSMKPPPSSLSPL